jgi:HTH-type transcriptional regulator, sugar sensing transcriptional regulator
MAITTLLKQLGFSDKEVAVYMALLGAGPSSVRALATQAGINRGTTYDILRSLMKRGLVTYYHQDTKQYFVAEDPSKLEGVIRDQIGELQQSQVSLQQSLPELQSLYNRADQKPVVKYYEGSRGIKTVLQDVLQTMAAVPQPLYYVYSAADVRQHLYRDFPNFARERVRRKIRCQVIAVGSGGELWGMDERKWISQTEGSPTYIIVYHGKLALISLSQQRQPIGMIIADQNLYQTHRMIFEHVWKSLP